MKTAPPHKPFAPIPASLDRSPVAGGGSNFRTHKLKTISPTRLAFTSTLGARMFGVAFIAVGIALLIGGVKLLSEGGLFDVPTIFANLGGLIFLAVGIWIYWLVDTAIVFDQDLGLFWRGKRPNLSAIEPKKRSWCRLSEVEGLQLLRVWISGEDRYYSYELIVVTDSGERLLAIDHGGESQILEDAVTLANWLEVPLWKCY